MKPIILLLIAIAPILQGCAQHSGHASAANDTATVTLLSPPDFQKNLLAMGATLLDVRTPSEYQKGHLKNARLLDIFSDEFEAEVDKLDKDKPYFVYCASGGRSSEAAELMHKKGFKKIFDLDGGISRWKSENLPVEK